MDYQKIYNKIIENRKQNPLSKDEYGEKHHIIPRCLGGNDKIENLVRLTAREHFLCHYCLVKIYEGKVEYHKMLHAFMIMKAGSVKKDTYIKFDKKGQRYINSRLYESLRKEYSKHQSLSQKGENNSQYGKVWVTKDKENRKINVIELTDYLSKGWIKGRWLGLRSEEKEIKESLKRKRKKDLINSKEKEIEDKKLKKETELKNKINQLKIWYEIYKELNFDEFKKITGYNKTQHNILYLFRTHLENYIPMVDNKHNVFVKQKIKRSNICQANGS